MLRVALTAVLTVLVSLPHGVCFCDFFSADISPGKFSCCSEPAQSKPWPTDEGDQDDLDCGCKLREIPVLSPTQVTSDRDGHAHVAILEWSRDAIARSSLVSCQSGSGLYDAVARHVVLTLRALLI